MTDRRQDGERAALAAERGLGVLSGDAERRASALEGADPSFAHDVARWRGRFAALFGEIEPVQPPEFLWQQIESATSGSSASPNVFDLHRSAARWRAAAIGMTALAASLAVVLFQQQPRNLPVPVEGSRPQAAPLVARLGDTDRAVKLVASWDPSGRRLVLAVTGEMSTDPRHSHELWIIPAGGKPSAIGVLPAGKQTHMQLADALAKLLREGATIAISVEPRGGSPTGQPTGPVVASGPLDQA
jgi:anti-sigma-K factor RskA